MKMFIPSIYMKKKRNKGIQDGSEEEEETEALHDYISEFNLKAMKVKLVLCMLAERETRDQRAWKVIYIHIKELVLHTYGPGIGYSICCTDLTGKP